MYKQPITDHYAPPTQASGAKRASFKFCCQRVGTLSLTTPPNIKEIGAHPSREPRQHLLQKPRRNRKEDANRKPHQRKQTTKIMRVVLRTLFFKLRRLRHRQKRLRFSKGTKKIQSSGTCMTKGKRWFLNSIWTTLFGCNNKHFMNVY